MKNRIASLRKYMKKENVDAMIISNFANIHYYSNFSSEDAYLFITMDEQFIITDDRYFLQAMDI